MTSQPPDDRFDDFETRLASRVQRHADRGVRPFDATEIARDAATTARAGAGRGGWGRAASRLGWILVGAALAGVALAGGTWVAGSGLLGTAEATPSPSLTAVIPTAAPTAEPTPAPTPTVVPLAACQAADLDARVTSWTGAAGSRIGEVSLTNHGAAACLLPVLERPQLVDGHGDVLINGAAAASTPTITVAAGGSVSTMVDAANYCGSDPVAPVSVAFQLAGGDRVIASPQSATDVFGVPPCNGSTEPSSMTMETWAH